MLIIKNQEYFDKVCAFASAKSAQHSQWLWEMLWWLAGYGDREIDEHECPSCRHHFVEGERGRWGGRSRTVLYQDFAPASFGITFMRQDKNREWRPFMEGGLIYSGDQSGWVNRDGSVIQPGESVPTFSVSVTRPENPWTVHT